VLNYALQRLAPLASLAAQRRWIAGGTPDNYLIPDQLLEDALDAARFAGLPHVRSGLPLGLVHSLERLAELVGRLSVQGIASEVLVESEPSWAAVREQSRACLAEAGFDLPAWEAAEGLVISAEPVAGSDGG
jgi:hypothetical protein